MPITRDPNNIYGLVDFTNEINNIDRKFELFGDQMFNMQPTATNTVMFDITDSKTTLLPSVERGSKHSVYGSDDNADTRIFGTVYYKVADTVAPGDIENERLIGTPDGVTTVEQATAKKMMKMREAMDQTDQYMRKKAVYEGKTVSPSGVEKADMFAELGLSQTVFDIKADVATTDILTKIRELKRLVTNALGNGGFYEGLVIDVDPIMFDKIISHESVKDAYKYFVNNQNQRNGLQPLRDTDNVFTHGGVTFREREGSFSLPTGVSEKIIADNTGHVIPVVQDLFRGWYGTSHKLSRVNGNGGVSPYYMYQYADPRDEGYDMEGDFSRLYLPTRPAALIKLTSTGA